MVNAQDQTHIALIRSATALLTVQPMEPLYMVTSTSDGQTVNELMRPSKSLIAVAEAFLATQFEKHLPKPTVAQTETAKLLTERNTTASDMGHILGLITVTDFTVDQARAVTEAVESRIALSPREKLSRAGIGGPVIDTILDALGFKKP